MHDITLLAKELGPRMVSQFYDSTDPNPRPPFFIKMNTRSPKAFPSPPHPLSSRRSQLFPPPPKKHKQDSWFYKEQGVFSMIRQLRPKEDDESGAARPPPPPRLKKCQALTPVDVVR